eukprot:g1845.t1
MTSGSIVLHARVDVPGMTALAKSSDIAVLGVESDFVDAHTGKSVPLSSTYVHHWFFRSDQASVSTSFGAGSEFRGSPEFMPAPYVSHIPQGSTWWAQLHFIDLSASQDKPEHFLPCIECRRRSQCGDGPCIVPSDPRVRPAEYLAHYPGGIYACDGGEFNTGADFCVPPSSSSSSLSSSSSSSSSPPPSSVSPQFPKVEVYRLKVKVKYQELATPALQQQAASVAITDATLRAEAPYVEYQVPTCKPTDLQCVHVKTSTWVLKDGFINCTSCPKLDPGIAPGNPYLTSYRVPRKPGLVWAMGHQHIGALGLELYLTPPPPQARKRKGNGKAKAEEEEGEKLIFASSPRYGTKDGGVAGDERGFLVQMSSQEWGSAPVPISEGTVLTVRSVYESHVPRYNTSAFMAAGTDVAHTGVMGYMRLRLVDLGGEGQ